MVRLKIAYWEFDFEAVCPTLDYDLLSQAHIYIYIPNNIITVVAGHCLFVLVLCLC